MAATRSSIHTNHLIKRRGNSGTAFASFSFTTYSLYQYMQFFFFFMSGFQKLIAYLHFLELQLNSRLFSHVYLADLKIHMQGEKCSVLTSKIAVTYIFVARCINLSSIAGFKNQPILLPLALFCLSALKVFQFASTVFQFSQRKIGDSQQGKDNLCSGSTLGTSLGSPCNQKALQAALKKQHHLTKISHIKVKISLSRRNLRHAVISHMTVLSPVAQRSFCLFYLHVTQLSLFFSVRYVAS